MIFSRDRVSCDDFGDCHDETTVAGVDFIGRRPIYGLLSTRGWVLLGAPTRTTTSPYEDSNSGSSISSLMVAERNSRSSSDDFVAYVVTDNATVDILSAI